MVVLFSDFLLHYSADGDWQDDAERGLYKAVLSTGISYGAAAGQEELARWK